VSAFAALVRKTPERGRLALFALFGALAVVVGFRAVDPRLASRLITGWGYYYILGVFAWFVYYAWKVARERRAVWTGWLRRPGRAGLLIAAAAAFAIWSDPFKHKILYDEYVIQGTAYAMHATKEVSTTVRAYDIGGTWLSIDTFLDKRPFFFPFLVSLVHDLTGYRMANLFALNAAFACALLALVFWLGRELAGSGPALLAVGLLATTPLFGQNATGAGMDLHNLTMIVLVACLAALYLRVPGEDRLSLLVLGAVLLAESRYESIIFIGPVAFVVAAGWVRAGRVMLPWPALVAPLLLIPYAWHNRVLSTMPFFWQLQDGQTSAFGLGNILNNLRGAWAFLFNSGPGLANSWYLSAMGFGGIGWLVWGGWRRFRSRTRAPYSGAEIAALAFGAGVVGHFCVLLFYWWARFDDLMASRFALPSCAAFALLTARWVSEVERPRLPALKIAAAGLGVWVLLGALPAIALRLYTDQNLVMQELDWEHAIVASRPGPVLLITNKSTIPFVLWHIPAIVSGIGRIRGEQIRYHLKEGTFKEVLVAQAMRPTSAKGEMGVDPDDGLPKSFHLVPIAEKRFGGRSDRISRLVSIDAEPESAPAPKAALASGAGAAASRPLVR